jgi:hypothetical protein
VTRFWSKVHQAGAGCWLWQGAKRDGYGRFWFRGEPQNAHRVAWQLVRGDIPPGVFVLHRCDVRACVNPDHLFLGMHSDNMADMKAKGRAVSGLVLYPDRAARGERVSLAKLTAADVREIRRRADNGETQRALGSAFGVDHKTIGSVLSRRTWAHVE